MANITGHRGKDISTILQAEEGKENGRPPRPTAGQRRKKRRRLNDLDSDSTVDEEESEEEFCLSERWEPKKIQLLLNRRRFLNASAFIPHCSPLAAARRKSSSCRKTSRSPKRTASPTTATTAATAAGSIGHPRGPGMHRNDGGAPESGGDQKGTPMMRKMRRTRKRKMKSVCRLG